jgi:hypothetical protein
MLLEAGGQQTTDFREGGAGVASAVPKQGVIQGDSC